VGEKYIEFITYDEYKVTIPIEELDKYKVILAIYMNGKKLEIENYGPLWVIYPVSSHKELQTTRNDAKLAWQVKSLIVK
jgi:hypothetical protein